MKNFTEHLPRFAFTPTHFIKNMRSYYVEEHETETQLQISCIQV